jgi:hypothetical protein
MRVKTLLLILVFGAQRAQRSSRRFHKLRAACLVEC